jgi:predicted adenylyl cyclase CyaB
MGEENSYEREYKFSGVELEGLRERLAELEAERSGPAAFEDNWVFDRDGELRSSGCVLRLRVDAGGAQLTFKGPARFEGGLKVRLEHETRLEDSDQMRSLLEALGYGVVRRYQKMREEWRLGGVTISLDRLPIGDFAEFEGDGCERVARRCGFEPEAAEKRSYLQLYEEFKEENPDAPPDMVFP